MSPDPQYYEPRQPRHAAICNVAKVTLQRHADAAMRIRSVELIDFSRQGMQVQTSTPLREGEIITATLENSGTGESFQFRARVRWRRQVDPQKWRAGCEFPAHTDWETLGELFLSGILSSVEISSPASS